MGKRVLPWFITHADHNDRHAIQAEIPDESLVVESAPVEHVKTKSGDLLRPWHTFTTGELSPNLKAWKKPFEKAYKQPLKVSKEEQPWLVTGLVVIPVGDIPAEEYKDYQPRNVVCDINGTLNISLLDAVLTGLAKGEPQTKLPSTQHLKEGRDRLDEAPGETDIVIIGLGKDGQAAVRHYGERPMDELMAEVNHVLSENLGLTQLPEFLATQQQAA